MLSFEKLSAAGPLFVQEQVKTRVQGRVSGVLAILAVKSTVGIQDIHFSLGKNRILQMKGIPI